MPQAPPDYRKLVLPVSMVILALAVYAFPNVPATRQFIQGIYAVLGFVLGIVFPALLLTILKLKNSISSR